MKIVDKRHVEFLKTVQVGDLIITDAKNYYQFIYDGLDDEFPYTLIDLSVSEVSDKYPSELFNELKVGGELASGEVIEEIVRFEDLTLEMRSGKNNDKGEIV